MGVTPTASADVIKKAFRRLALKYHPDKNPGDSGAAAQFKEISAAYKVLVDPAQRKKYDASLPKVAPAAAAAPRSTTAKKTEPGKNLLYNLSLTLEESFAGVEKTISYMRSVNGQRQSSSVAIKVPAGIQDQKKLRVRGAGESSPGQSAGDLLVAVHIKTHDFYSLDGRDVILRMPLSPLDLMGLSALKIPTLHGPVLISVDDLEDLQNPTLKLSGKGYPSSENKKQFGDQFVRFMIDVPPAIDETLKEKLRQIQKSLPKSELQKQFDKFSRS